MASRPVRLSLSLLMFAVLAGQGAVPTAAAISGAGWQVVLAAGDDAEPVFDNATRELGQRLAAAGVSASNIHRLSANAAELSPDVEPAQALDAFGNQPSAECLSAYIAGDRETFPTGLLEQLDHFLARGHMRHVRLGAERRLIEIVERR